MDVPSSPSDESSHPSTPARSEPLASLLSAVSASLMPAASASSTASPATSGWQHDPAPSPPSLPASGLPLSDYGLGLVSAGLNDLADQVVGAVVPASDSLPAGAAAGLPVEAAPNSPSLSPVLFSPPSGVLRSLGSTAATGSLPTLTSESVSSTAVSAAPTLAAVAGVTRSSGPSYVATSVPATLRPSWAPPRGGMSSSAESATPLTEGRLAEILTAVTRRADERRVGHDRELLETIAHLVRRLFAADCDAPSLFRAISDARTLRDALEELRRPGYSGDLCCSQGAAYADVQVSEMSLRSATARADALQRENAMLRGDLATLTSQYDQMRRRFEASVAECNDSASQVRQMEAEREHQATLHRARDQLAADNQRFAEEADRRAHTAVAECQVLRERVADLTASNADLTDRLAIGDGRMYRLVDQHARDLELTATALFAQVQGAGLTPDDPAGVLPRIKTGIWNPPVLIEGQIPTVPASSATSSGAAASTSASAAGSTADVERRRRNRGVFTRPLRRTRQSDLAPTNAQAAVANRRSLPLLRIDSGQPSQSGSACPAASLARSLGLESLADAMDDEAVKPSQSALPSPRRLTYGSLASASSPGPATSLAPPPTAVAPASQHVPTGLTDSPDESDSVACVGVKGPVASAAVSLGCPRRGAALLATALARSLQEDEDASDDAVLGSPPSVSASAPSTGTKKSAAGKQSVGDPSRPPATGVSVASDSAPASSIPVPAKPPAAVSSAVTAAAQVVAAASPPSPPRPPAKKSAAGKRKASSTPSAQAQPKKRRPPPKKSAGSTRLNKKQLAGSAGAGTKTSGKPPTSAPSPASSALPPAHPGLPERLRTSFVSLLKRGDQALSRELVVPQKMQPYRDDLRFYHVGSPDCWQQILASQKRIPPREGTAHGLHAPVTPSSGPDMEAFLDFSSPTHPCRVAHGLLPATPVFLPPRFLAEGRQKSAAKLKASTDTLLLIGREWSKFRGEGRFDIFQALWERNHWIMSASVVAGLHPGDGVVLNDVEIAEVKQRLAAWTEYELARSKRSDLLRKSFHVVGKLLLDNMCMTVDGRRVDPSDSEPFSAWLDPEMIFEPTVPTYSLKTIPWFPSSADWLAECTAVDDLEPGRIWWLQRPELHPYNTIFWPRHPALPVFAPRGRDPSAIQDLVVPIAVAGAPPPLTAAASAPAPLNSQGRLNFS